MSHNGYSQYSPYYQPNESNAQQQSTSGQQHGGNQYQNEPRVNGQYSTNSYQPLSAYQSEHQRQQNQTRPSHQTSSTYGPTNYSGTNSYGGPGYGNLGATTSAEQDIAQYASNRLEATSRSDTSALGNLAYASSLGQDNQPSLSQLIDYNRARGSTSYGTSSPGGISQDRQRTGSGGQSYTSKHQTIQSTPYSRIFQDANARAYQGQDYNGNSTGRSSPAQDHFSATQRQPSQTYAQNQYASQASRPTSGQAMPRPSSRASSHNNQSPQNPNNQVNQARPQMGSAQDHGLPQVSNIQQVGHQSSPTGTPKVNQGLPKPTTQTSAASSKSNARPRSTLSKAKSQSSGQEPTQTLKQPTFHGNTGSENPTTVDPSKIFNQSEWLRRQIEQHEAEKAKKNKNSPMAATSPPADDVTQAARALVKQSGSAASDSTTKEQIELEMKAMIEKMRDYKAKDPGLFTQVWEEVKKGTPTQRAASPSATTSFAASPMLNGHSTSAQQIELPAEADFDPTPFPPGIDRGRYPMQRRRRGNAHYHPDKQSSNKKMIPSELTPSFPSAPESSTTDLPCVAPRKNGTKKTHESRPAPVSKTAQQTPQQPQMQAPTQLLPTQPASSGTFWPENKKRALADAARVALTSHPSNAGKTITADEIHKVLNGNPSYHQLCDFLEFKGFKVDRVAFARHLLSAVPDMTSAQASQQPLPPANSAVPQPPPYETPVGCMKTNQSQALMLGQESLPARGQQSGGLAIKPEAQSAQAAQLSKEEKARKRSFGDIVDLTALSEEDDFMRHRPKPRIEQPKPPPPLPPSTEPVNSVSNLGLMHRWKMPTPTHSNVLPPQKQSTPRNARENLLYDMVVEPMSKRRDALRRSSYYPRTIARDILLATGKHPSLHPLNHHLDSLKERFISVDNNSDLSTFRWDLVDPGGLPGPTPISRMLQHGQEQGGDNEIDSIADTPIFERAQAQALHVGDGAGVSTRTLESTRPLKNRSLQPKRKGRPPKSRPSQILPMGDLHPRMTPAGAPRAPSNTAPFTRSPGRTPAVQQIPSNNTSSPSNASMGRPASGPATTPADNPPTASLSSATPGSGQPTDTPRERVPGRKGRPPGARNRAPRSDKGLPKKKPSQDQLANQSTSSLPTHIKRETSTPVSSTPARQSGLRNVMTPSGSGIAVVIPSRSSSIVDPSSPSVSKASDPNVNLFSHDKGSSGRHPPFSSPHHSYNCRWKNCSARTSNLATLRMHVREVHREAMSTKGPWECKWADCCDPVSSARRITVYEEEEGQEAEIDAAEFRKRKRLVYQEPKKWDRHVERKHLTPYAWEIGGKAAGHVSDIDSSDYLSDASGRRVTPQSYQRSIRRSHPDPLPLNTDPKVVQEYHEAHANDSETAKRKAHVRALTAKKKKVGGMGVYRTGQKVVGDGLRRKMAETADSEKIEVVENPDVGGEGWMDGLPALKDRSKGKGKGKEKDEARGESETGSGGSEEDFERV